MQALQFTKSYHPLIHSPNLRPAMPRSEGARLPDDGAHGRPVFANRIEDLRPSVAVATPEQRARDEAADQIAARRRSFWEAEHPGGNWYSDQDEYLALGRELTEAGLGHGLGSLWLAMCCSHYRTALDGGTWRFLDTHQTEMQRPSPGVDARLVCVRCGATFPRLNREACRGNEIYRERVRDDKARLGQVLDLYSLLKGS